jgi:hypothetical protein
MSEAITIYEWLFKKMHVLAEGLGSPNAFLPLEEFKLCLQALTEPTTGVPAALARAVAKEFNHVPDYLRDVTGSSIMASRIEAMLADLASRQDESAKAPTPIENGDSKWTPADGPHAAPYNSERSRI